MAFTISSIEPISLIIGMLIVFFLCLIVIGIIKLRNKKEPKQKTSLPQLKSYVKEAHNHMVESANNLIKLYEVFNEIEESKQ